MGSGNSGGNTPGYSLSATVSGLTSSGLVLSINGTRVSVSSTATSVTLASGLPSGSTYTVTVAKQPAMDSCVIANGTGTLAGANITNIGISCANALTPITSGVAARDLGGPSDGTLPSSGTVSVTLASDPGEFLGEGRSYSYSDQNSTIRVSSGSNWFVITGDGTDAWAGWIQLPSGEAQFQPGTYSGLIYGPSPAGSLDWTMADRYCFSGTGTLTVNSVTYVAGAMTAIDFNFDQYCALYSTTGLHGHVVWNAAGTSISAGPVDPPPTGLWRAAASDVPSTGNYIYLESDPADYVGQGMTYSETPLNSLFTITTVPGGVRVREQGAHLSDGFVQAVFGQTQLQPGFYGQVERWQVGDPARGGLTWDVDSRGCNISTGWFVVNAVSYTKGAISALDMRFEQHCELWLAAPSRTSLCASSNTVKARQQRCMGRFIGAVSNGRRSYDRRAIPPAAAQFAGAL